MNTELLSIDYDKDMLRQRRIWYGAAAILFVLSLVSQQPLVFLAALFTLFIGIVPELWYRRSLRHLVIQQTANQSHLFFGEEMILSLTIENQKFLPLPWLQVEDKITPPLTLLSKRVSRLQALNQDSLISTWLLWTFERVTRRYRMRCQSRGVHVFGPVRLSSSDPFGWLESEVWVPAYETLLVYPLIAPLESLGLSSVHPLGDYTSERRLLEDPLRVAGVREYTIGDDPRRIHWKASAHAGTLQSKIYEPSSLRRLLLLLDTWNYSHAVKGPDLDIQELTITTAASLAAWALEEGYMVGLLTNSAMVVDPDEQGAEQLATATQDSKSDATSKHAQVSVPGVRVPFARDEGQHERVLSTLARLAPSSHTTIERIIDLEEDMFPLGTTIMLISASTSLSDATIERLLDLRMRGAAIHIALAGEADELTRTETFDLPVHAIGGKEKWRELVTTVGDKRSGTIGTSTTSLQLD